MSTSYADLAHLLSTGLDLCVRARKLDELVEKSIAVSEITDTHCLTPAVWVLDQYDADLKAWETAARASLLQLAEAP